MSIREAYRLRLKRQRYIARALWKRRELRPVTFKAKGLPKDAIVLFACLYDERIRLPYFFQYYRELGVEHFFIVDNDSKDGGAEYLREQPDVSLWHTAASYKASRFGVDWLMGLMWRHGHGRWCLIADVDEFLVYPYCETRPLRALTDWLAASGHRALGAMLLDMYPRGQLQDHPYHEGQNPFEIAQWFDSGNYSIDRNPQFGNLWIQGGPRARLYFQDNPKAAPALNKIPLIKWNRRYAYVSSTHMLLPRGLNFVYDQWGGEKISGCLLHAKFLDTFAAKANAELARGQHYANSREYIAYKQGLEKQPDFWCKWSEKYINWRQLEILGLMSKGDWA